MIVQLPSDYVDFISRTKILSAETNVDSDIEFEPLDQVIEFNSDIEIEDHAPGYIAFACDGGNEVFAFNSEGAVFLLPMVGMEPQVAEKLADSWVEFESSVLINA